MAYEDEDEGEGRKSSSPAAHQAVHAAATALLARNAGEVLNEYEGAGIRAMSTGNPRLTAAAKAMVRGAKGKDKLPAKLRADAYCVLALLGTANATHSAALLHGATALRQGHFRQHVIRSGVLLNALSEGSHLHDSFAPKSRVVKLVGKARAPRETSLQSARTRNRACCAKHPVHGLR